MSLKTVKRLGRRLNVNFRKTSTHQLRKGIGMEGEHDKGGKFDVLPGKRNILGRAKIAMGHLSEIPDYYTRLHRMERQATKESLHYNISSLYNIINS